jgi:FSR family fosmidomycin resistance protein-like MFS transporter
MAMNKKALALLSIGHLVTDLNQGALPALLPFFKESLSLSYTVAGTILLFSNLTSSVIQPAFGYFSDKHPRGWILPLAPFLACLGMAVTGFVSVYPLLILAVMVSGLGIASFHPEGFKTAHFFTGEKKATGMSLFAVGGNLGVALGPIWALALVASFGMKGTVSMIIPGLLLGAVFLFSIRWLTGPVQSAFTQTRKEKKLRVSRHDLFSLLILIGIVILRSWVQMGLVTYIPFYYINYLKGDPLYAGKLVSTFLMAGALGTLVGSPMADLWGHKRFLSCSMILTIPFLLIFVYGGGPTAIVALALAGMLFISTFSVTIVMAQTILPYRLGMASGLMVGFAVGTGGIGVTFLGMIADHWGVPVAMKSILLLPLVGFVLSLFVQYPPRAKHDEEGH